MRREVDDARHEGESPVGGNAESLKSNGAHRPSNRPTPARERAMAFVHPEPMSGCWLWLGTVDVRGYGTISEIDPRGGRRVVLAHRLSYEMHKGPIAHGLVIDHKCRTTVCVNPDHLEAVTIAENIQRGIDAGFGPGCRQAARTHCPKGHEYTPENTRSTVTRSGWRQRTCRACARADAQRRREVLRARRTANAGS